MDYLYGDSPKVRHVHVRDPAGEEFRLTGEARRYREYYSPPPFSNDYRRVTGEKTC
ncbi:hypothetical protein [Streptosporangium roseum]|uniref:hypothetical protein n=1 Tax=Streptosporangium roseum TaxID=2001 RepID=UPI00332AA73B